LASPPELRARYGIDVREIAGGVALIASHGPIGMNRVLGVGFDGAFDKSTLAEVIDTYRRARVPRFLLQWSPAANNRTGDEFVDQGFAVRSRMAKLFRRCGESVSATSELQLVKIDRASS